MINNIHIKNEASFGEDTQPIANLKKINFFYGANGSGKTTISRIISDESSYEDCSISWENGNKLKTFVYNRDFINSNFNSDKELKGIFTLGEDNDTVMKDIEGENEKLTEIKNKLNNKNKTLAGEDGHGGKRAELERLENNFTDKCWDYKKKYEGVFKEAFKGSLGARADFKERIIQESENNNCDLLTSDELEEKAKTIFVDADDLNKEEVISPIQYDDLIVTENATILSKKVIGKDDVDISAMIKKLGNSDWVKQGRAYYDKNDGYCPFCQQKIDEEFKKSLQEYFDEEYDRDIVHIEDLEKKYNVLSNNVVQNINSILSIGSQHINYDTVNKYKEELELKIRINKERLDKKKKEASTIVKLESLESILKKISDEIGRANDKIKEHNALVDNIKKEKQTLISQIWRFISEEIKFDYNAYNTNKKNINNAIANIENEIKDLEKEARTKSKEIKSLESKVTSIQPTIDAINSLLDEFGFNGFYLDKSNKDGFYSIARPNGEDIKDTLSEGEKTFITFLYFYHLLKGSETTSGITEDRVVVFDDPISSLDSDILFIVSHLIKGLFKEVREGKGHIKQIMVLTHNIYFHKEVTFNSKRRGCNKLKDETFWIIKKDNNCSKVFPYEENPIKSSYELLWDEVKSPNNSTIRNTLRRILEHYFKILGGINLDKIADGFQGKEKIICGTLLSWVHDGSHNVDEDLYISCDDETVGKYLDVFTKIFEKSGHIEHYNMMMGTYNANKANNIVNLLEEAQ